MLEMAYRVMHQRLKLAGHNVSPETTLAQLRRIQRQSVSINLGAPISSISTINREQATILAALNIKKTAPNAQMNLL
jgi:hypothetical protein